MSDDRTTEYVTLFVVGALVGVGAAMLLAPAPPTRRERVMKQIKPYRKKLDKKAAKVRKQAGRQVDSVGEWGDELRAAAGTIMSDLREEVAELVADARNQIAESMETQLDAAHKSLRRGTRKIRT